jgi:hypothetical protein
MSLEKSMNEVERHLDFAKSHLIDLIDEIERELKDVNIELADQNKELQLLTEQNELLEEQVEELNKKLAIFELENMELRLRIEVYNAFKKE